MRLYTRLLQIVAMTFAGLTLIFMGLAIFTARAILFPTWYPAKESKDLPPCSGYQQRVYVDCHDPLKDLNLPFEELSIVDGDVKGHSGPVRTTGWAIQIDPRDLLKGTVILVHGGGADRRALLRHAGYLHDAGYDVVLIDCHNHGMSGRDGGGISFGYWESRSVIDAAIWAKQHLPAAGAHPVIAMGTSQGGFAVLKAMADSPLIRGAIAENPYVSLEEVVKDFPALTWEPRIVKSVALRLISWRIGIPLSELDVHAFAGSIGQRPVFLIHGLADTIVSPTQSREIYDLLKGPRDLWFVPDGEHEQLINVAGDAYRARVVRFLDSIAEAPRIVQGKSPPTDATAPTEGAATPGATATTAPTPAPTPGADH